jgi:glutamine synthetase
MADTKPDPKAVMAFVKEHNVQILDLRFTDIPGLWHHVSYPIGQLSEASFEEGFGMDGSSIRGWAAIHESDMLLIPDASNPILDPFTEAPTLVMVCDVIDPVTKQRYDRDPRYIAKKAEMFLASTGLADTAYFGAEAEFFIFDNVRFDQNEHEGYYFIDAEEGRWNSGRVENNLGYRPRYKEGYFPVPPTDHYQDLRTEMALTMQNCGLVVECHHHEVATGGQTEIDLKFNSLIKSADAMMLYKYIAKNVANQYGKTVTFMPKPLFQDNGSGMHTHQSLWKGGKPLFAGDGYAGLSQLALWYIGGLIKHGPALSAIIAPTTNSYKRLVPGFEAPVNLAYSRRNRSAACRIPMYSASPKAKRVEFRPPDPSCNPYLAFSAMLMAGLDGIENKIDPGQPLDKDIYDLGPEELAKVPSMPGSLESALDALAHNYQFLLRGDVFTEEMLNTFIDYKREKEVNAMRLRPHPYEFQMYYDI